MVDITHSLIGKPQNLYGSDKSGQNKVVLHLVMQIYQQNEF